MKHLSRAFDTQMRRVPALTRRLRHRLGEKDVHAMRVALRRSRSIALALRGVDPNPAWRDVGRMSKRVFRTLGELRDLQVSSSRIDSLVASGVPCPASVLREIAARESAAQRRVRRAVNDFDAAAWWRLARQLKRRLTAIAPDGLAARSLVWAEVQDISQRHADALHRPTTERWHALRKSLKRLRDDVACFAPSLHAAWDTSLRELQALLGDVHDFDQLETLVEDARTTRAMSADRALLQRALGHERRTRLEAYRARTAGPNSPIRRWLRDVLPRGGSMSAPALAQLKAAAESTGADPHRLEAIVRVAERLFTKSAGRMLGRTRDTRTMLLAAAALSTMRPVGASRSAKAVARVIRSLAVPPGLTPQQMTLVSLVVRQARRKDPAAHGRRLGELTAADRATVTTLGGVIRIALKSAGPT